MSNTRSAASYRIEEEYFARIQEDRDTEASELRLSVIEYLDRCHARIVDRMNRSEYGNPQVNLLEEAAWAALELVRSIERKIAYGC